MASVEPCVGLSTWNDTTGLIFARLQASSIGRIWCDCAMRHVMPWSCSRPIICSAFSTGLKVIEIHQDQSWITPRDAAAITATTDVDSDGAFETEAKSTGIGPPGRVAYR
jgi:hypothetical protein